MANSIAGKIYEGVVDLLKYSVDGVTIYPGAGNQNRIEIPQVSSNAVFNEGVKITGEVLSAQRIEWTYGDLTQISSSDQLASGDDLFDTDITVSMTDPTSLQEGDTYDVRAFNKTVTPGKVNHWLRGDSGTPGDSIIVFAPESVPSKINGGLDNYDWLLVIVLDLAVADTEDLSRVTDLIDWSKDVKDIIINYGNQIVDESGNCLVRDIKPEQELFECSEVDPDSYRAELHFRLFYQEGEEDSRSLQPS